MKKIILFGMRGTGKSTIGKIISEKLNYHFVDLDEFMNEKVGNINDYIQEKGWNAFRDLEHESLKEVLKLDGNYVISLGGGTIIFPRNVEEITKLDDKILIFLETKLENIAQRIEKDEKNNKKRASLTGKSVLDELKEVYAQREDIYKQNAQYIINNDGSLEKTVEDILKIINTKKVCVPIVNFDENYLSESFKKLKNIDEIEYVELRIDFLENKEKLAEIIKSCPKKTIVTNRIKEEGGNFVGTAQQTYQIQKNAIKNGAYLVDLELSTLERLENFDENKFKNKLIVSYHNFEKTPNLDKLKEILKNMEKFSPKVYKIAVKPNNKDDVQTIYDLVDYFKKNYIGKDFIFISMGELGMETRINVPKMGGFLSFASFGGKTSAPGQIDYKTLYENLVN